MNQHLFKTQAIEYRETNIIIHVPRPEYLFSFQGSTRVDLSLTVSLSHCLLVITLYRMHGESTTYWQLESKNNFSQKS